MSSSIQEAFAKAMTHTQAHFSPIPDEWDDEGNAAKIETTTTKEQPTMQTQRSYFTVTNNVTRSTFNYVLEHPGLRRVEISNALEMLGFKKSSTTSILGQLVAQGLVIEDGFGHLTAATAEYRPLKGSAARKKLQEQQAAQQKPKTKAAVQTTANTSVQEDFSAEKIVERLTPKQAKAVYDYLKELFA